MWTFSSRRHLLLCRWKTLVTVLDVLGFRRHSWQYLARSAISALWTELWTDCSQLQKVPDRFIPLTRVFKTSQEQLSSVTMSVFSFLRQRDNAGICRWAPAVQYYPGCRAHSSKPTAAVCGGRMMGRTDRQTDGRTDGRSTVSCETMFTPWTLAMTLVIMTAPWTLSRLLLLLLMRYDTIRDAILTCAQKLK